MSLVYVPSQLRSSHLQPPTQKFLTVYFNPDDTDMNIQAPTFEVACLVRARRLAAPSVDTHAKIA
jgi:hypothetical protein